LAREADEWGDCISRGREPVSGISLLSSRLSTPFELEDEVVLKSIATSVTHCLREYASVSFQVSPPGTGEDWSAPRSFRDDDPHPLGIANFLIPRLGVKAYLKMLLLLLVNHFASLGGTFVNFQSRQRALDRLQPLFRHLIDNFPDERFPYLKLGGGGA
jgi:hypothetical protein